LVFETTASKAIRVSPCCGDFLTAEMHRTLSARPQEFWGALNRGCGHALRIQR
jgi:hypothetical protein